MLYIRNKKGMTLVEVIVVIVIMLVVAGIAIPSISYYRQISEHRYRENVAKSIFIASQNALTQKYSTGLFSKLNNSGTVMVDTMNHDISDYYSEEININNENIVYLSISKGEGSNSELYNLIEPYLLDKARLNDAVLIEYNKITGKVLSAFYSDKIQSFGYGTGNFVDVTDRSLAARKDKKFGYFGVATTGTFETTGTIGEFNATLIDHIDKDIAEYGLLTLELNLPADYDTDSVIYDLYIADNRILSLYTNGNFEFTLTDVSNDITYAFQNPLGELKHIMYTKDSEGRKIFVLVLDSIIEGYNINKYYAGIDNVSVKVVARLGALKRIVETNQEHSLYDKINNNICEITSIRHLNNVRYGNTFNSFKQMCDVYAYDYSGTPYKYFKPIETFSKVYDGNKNRIYNLNINTDEAALFNELTSNSTVKNVILSSPNIQGVTYAAGIACNNSGIIENSVIGVVENDASVNGSITVTGEGFAGGLVSNNLGTVRNCVNAINIISKNASSETYAGGIVGGNVNSAIVENCYNTGVVFSSGYSGGIAGINDSNSIIRDCYNNGRINIELGNIGTPLPNNNFSYTNSLYIPGTYMAGIIRLGISGGVVGYNKSSVQYCYNSNYVGTENGGLFGKYESGSVVQSVFLINEYNRSQNIAGIECSVTESQLKSKYGTAADNYMLPATKYGRFNYIYPYIKTNVHDFPWEKVSIYDPTDRILNIENSESTDACFLSFDPSDFDKRQDAYLTIYFSDKTIEFYLDWKIMVDNANLQDNPKDAVNPIYNGIWLTSSDGQITCPVYAKRVNGQLSEIVVMLNYIDYNNNISGILIDDYFTAKLVVVGKEQQEFNYNVPVHNLFGNVGTDNQDINLIRNTRHLLNIKYKLNGTFLQTDNIDLQDIGLLNQTLSGNNEFTGVYDGDGYSISNLQINKNTSDNIGLFSTVGSSGVIKNVDLKEINITGNNNVGAVCGVNKGVLENIIIQNSNTSNKIYGINNIGGICGNNSGGTITNCYNNGVKTEGNNNVGGIAGYSENNSHINDSICSSVISGNDSVGGISGKSINSYLTNVENISNVTGTSNVGGICGYADGLTSTGYLYNNRDNVNKINGTNSVGGIFGNLINNSSINTGSENLNIIAGNGEVNGSENVGGIVGSIKDSTIGNISFNYRQIINNGKITGTKTSSSNTGGLIGKMDSNSYMYNCFNTGTVSAVNNTQMQYKYNNVPFVGYAVNISDITNYLRVTTNG